MSPFFQEIAEAANDRQLLIDCYLSDQMSERQWQQHLVDTPGLREAWSAFNRGGTGLGPALDADTPGQYEVGGRSMQPTPSRRVGRHPALDASYSLRDGTDISRKTVDWIKAARQRADLKFFEQSRKLSPVFPSVADALDRRQCLRETIAARTFMVGIGLGLASAIWTPFGFPLAMLSVIGFVITATIAGNRCRGKLLR